MAQVYAPSRTTTPLPAAALFGVAAVVIGGLSGMLWALAHSPVVLLAWVGAAAFFWLLMFATAADEE